MPFALKPCPNLLLIVTCYLQHFGKVGLILHIHAMFLYHNHILLPYKIRDRSFLPISAISFLDYICMFRSYLTVFTAARMFNRYLSNCDRYGLKINQYSTLLHHKYQHTEFLKNLCHGLYNTDFGIFILLVVIR